MRKLSLGVLLSCACAATATAHDFWIQPDTFSTVPSATLSLALNIGHAESRQHSPIAGDRIIRFEAIAPTGARVDLRAGLQSTGPAHDASMHVQETGTYVLVLETDNRARSHLPAGRFNEYVRDEGLTPALEHRQSTGRMDADGTEMYSRRAKALVHVQGAAAPSQSRATQPLGLSLEIVPEVDPYAKPRPAALPVRVFYEARPLAGALVKLIELEGDAGPVEVHVTDLAGRAQFVMPAAGNWLVNVVWTKPLAAEAETAFETTFSSLTFGLPQLRPMTGTDLVGLKRIAAVSVSPDDRWLVWQQRDTDLVRNSTDSQLWLLDLEQRHAAPERIASTATLHARNPAFSRDGKWIYFIGAQSGMEQLWRVALDGGALVQLSRFDVGVDRFLVSPDGHEIVLWADAPTSCDELPCDWPQPAATCCGSGLGFERLPVRHEDSWATPPLRALIFVPQWNAWATPETRSRTYVMSSTGGKAKSSLARWTHADGTTLRWRNLAQEGRVSHVLATRDGGAIVALDSMLASTDLYRVAASGELTPLTAINADRLAEIDMPKFDRFSFADAEGNAVQGWVLTPRSATTKLPTILVVNDDLDGDVTNTWSDDVNPVLLSAPGYTVVGFNGKSLKDLQLGLAAAAKDFASVNAENACAIGGGDMMLRIAGNWPRGFKCLVAHAPIFDVRAMAYESDEPGRYQQDERERSNPVNHVTAWSTPLLALHGERDSRVPYTQSIAAFTAAQRRGVPSRLVVFPDEGHSIEKPKNSIQWYGETFTWLRTWLVTATASR